jgi:putative RecB family exonuclease
MDLKTLRQQPHLSASSISAYIDCSLQYYFSRVKKVPIEFVPDNLAFGTAIHATLADYYRAKMTGNRFMQKDVHSLFRQHWRKEAEGRGEMINYAEGKDYNSYIHEGIDLLNAWFAYTPDDNFTVIGIEEAFSFQSPNLPIPIIGAMDLIQADSAGTVVITDFKTANKSYTTDLVNQNMQMTVYQLACKSNGYADREILLKLDCLIKTKTPKFESYWTTRNETDEKRLIRKAQKIWNAISNAAFVPNDTSWKCKGCQYKQACDRWFTEGE